MKIIDLLNKIAKGEELPKRIKYKCDIYIIGEDACNKDVKYINENKDVDGYTKYLFQDWILDVILNDEVEIIEEKPKHIEEIKLIEIQNLWDRDIEIEKKIKEISKAVNYLLDKEK